LVASLRVITKRQVGSQVMLHTTTESMPHRN
jgi:hypothetical protein